MAVNPSGAWSAVWRREWARLRAAPLDLAMISWVPLLLALLLLWTFSAGLATRLPVAVLDQDHSTVSRQLLRLLDAAPGLRLALPLADEGEARAALHEGRVYGVVVIRDGLARELKSGRAATVTLLHNAQFSTHSGLIQKDVRAAVGTLSAALEILGREKRGQAPLAAAQGFEPLRVALASQYNPAGNTQQFLASALLPALLHLLAMVAGAWTVGRELRDASSPQWWDAARGRAWPALLAKLAPAWLALCGVDLLAGLALHGLGLLPGAAAAPLLALHAALLALYLALGAAAALLSRSLRLALSAAGFITAPAFAFSGIGFPLMAMPEGARLWAEALPLTWLMRAQVALQQQGAPAATALPLLGALLGGALLLLALSAWRLPRVANDPASWGRR
ncbi:ABC transporter permease [Pelomonas sp. CA6]|uniref:ABC transporter permease n=1 Tax=Pelomonas sp. CA6 TaxID=2907999 RepID=UPI001F4B0F18|nr:ABC transporter permease [Pelomonas sp. CA6]MCH7342767.1 ABC transporter permease [Pelomonas sp. CA6]